MPTWAYESIRLFGLQADGFFFFIDFFLKSAQADCAQYFQVIKWFETDFKIQYKKKEEEKNDFIWSFDIYLFIYLITYECAKNQIFVDSLNKALGLAA